MAEHWTSHRFSLGNPRHDGAGDLPRLLRRLAQEIEDRGITATDIDDLTLTQEITADGPWFSTTLYWTPSDPTSDLGAPDEAPIHDADSDAAGTQDAGEDAGEPVRVPVGEALPGVTLYPLPQGEVIVASFTLVKTRDADAEVGWYTRVTHDYNRVEFLGALTAYVDHLRAEEASGWSDDEDAPHPHADIDT